MVKFYLTFDETGKARGGARMEEDHAIQSLLINYPDCVSLEVDEETYNRMSRELHRYKLVAGEFVYE